jgi:hypothetical protein
MKERPLDAPETSPEARPARIEQAQPVPPRRRHRVLFNAVAPHAPSYVLAISSSAGLKSDPQHK